MRLQVIQQRSLWWTISIAIILSGIIAMLISWQQIGAPLRPSLDFVGGTRLQLELDCTKLNSCPNPIDPAIVREVLAGQDLASSSIQVIGKDQHTLSIRTSTLDVDQRTKLIGSLAEKLGEFDPSKLQNDTVGPTLGKQIFSSGLLALLFSFAGIMLYLSVRFKLDYAVFSIVALLHDVLITAGIFAILGLLFQVEVDSLFLVSLLTIVGFSVNDTVVIYDRIREVLETGTQEHIDTVVDDAVNQTLGRSVNTTVSALLPLTAIFFLGGETLKYFALALIIGFTTGAYSSIFIASTLLAWWRVKTGQGSLPSKSVAVEEA
jgi:preprotein translocase subunit SecF